MEELIKSLKNILGENFECDYDCEKCILNKKFNPDFYDDKSLCDVLIDINDYINFNEL